MPTLAYARWLVVTCLAAPGCGGDDGLALEGSTSHADSGSTSLARTTTDSTSTSTSTTSDDTEGTSGESTGRGSTTFVAETGTGTTDTGTTDTGTTDTGTTAACLDHCSVQIACTKAWRSEAACVEACEANLVEAAAFEEACAAAWEDLYACLGTLTCEELAQWMSPMRFPYPCLSEDEVLGFECSGQ